MEKDTVYPKESIIKESLYIRVSIPLIEFKKYKFA